jgi:hypothetical protein
LVKVDAEPLGLPIYLKEDRHLSLQPTVEVASLYYAVVSLVALGTGWLTD